MFLNSLSKPPSFFLPVTGQLLEMTDGYWIGREDGLFSFHPFLPECLPDGFPKSSVWEEYILSSSERALELEYLGLVLPWKKTVDVRHKRLLFSSL